MAQPRHSEPLVSQVPVSAFPAESGFHRQLTLKVGKDTLRKLVSTLVLQVRLPIDGYLFGVLQEACELFLIAAVSVLFAQESSRFSVEGSHAATSLHVYHRKKVPAIINLHVVPCLLLCTSRDEHVQRLRRYRVSSPACDGGGHR